MPEKRIVLKNCGIVNPDDISTYLDRDGFKALEKVRETMTALEVSEQIKASGLKGRGGAGFSCGLKWETARKTESDRKFLICNADEGEVGTFKDRYILENDPFCLIEGMAIAGYAMGAQLAYIYLRGDGFDGTAKVVWSSADGETVYVEKGLEPVGGEWSKARFALRPKVEDPNAAATIEDILRIVFSVLLVELIRYCYSIVVILMHLASPDGFF